ncbi:MAG: peptidylprolyl isomerase [Planctomycetota bacterium]
MLSARGDAQSTFVAIEFNIPIFTNSLDTVFIELFDDRPLTRDNFLQYVDGELYDNTFFHRLAQGFVLQGGGFIEDVQFEPSLLNASLNPDSRVDLDGDPLTSNPSVANEFSNTPLRLNTVGTLAMAKLGGDPDSATNQFFFNLDNNSNLDTQNGGFTVFAGVVGNGMTLLNAYNNGLEIRNLNPDDNDDGIRDPGPFGGAATDGVPTLGGTQLLTLEKASRVQYYGSNQVLDLANDTFFFEGIDAFLDEGVAFANGDGQTLLNRSVSRLGIAPGATIVNRLENWGVFAPGLQLGVVTVPQFRQAFSGTLEVQLRGPTAGADHDQLAVTGNATLDGTLDISTIANFSPTLGSEFTILTAGSIVGEFTSLAAPDLGDALGWHVEITADEVVLSVVRSGDYDGSGVIDTADYDLWRANFGSTTFFNADGNGDGRVDSADFTIWRDAFSQVAGAGAAALFTVPEPSCVVALAVACLPFATRRRR